MLLNKKDYFEKVEKVLTNTSKFKRVNKNPIASIKKKANTLIAALNSKLGDIKLDTLIGDFSPGYLYGNIKTHKDVYPI